MHTCIHTHMVVDLVERWWPGGIGRMDPPPPPPPPPPRAGLWFFLVCVFPLLNNVLGMLWSQAQCRPCYGNRLDAGLRDLKKKKEKKKKVNIIHIGHVIV